VRAIVVTRGQMFRKFFKDQRGATAIEYGLIAALVVTAIVGGISSVGQSSVLTLANISKHL
jgi:pilus assembly protein Flp/PilA